MRVLFVLYLYVILVCVDVVGGGCFDLSSCGFAVLVCLDTLC